MASECAADCARVARREVLAEEAPARSPRASNWTPTGHKAIGTLPVQLAIRNDGGQPIRYSG